MIGRRPTPACLWHALPRGSGGMLPRENLKMPTLGDAFSLSLGAKSRAFRTEFYL